MTNTSAQVGAYVGDGGILLHLDEVKPGHPANPLMVKQLAKGSLRVATVTEAAGEAPARPASNATVAQWREWAVSAGMPPYEVEGLTKKQILMWADGGDGSLSDDVVE